MPTVTKSFYPSSLNYELMSGYNTVEDPAHPLTTGIGKGPDSSEYAKWNIDTTSDAASRVVYNFDLSSIPENATINKVDGKVKASISNTSSNTIKSRTAYFRYIFNGNWTLIGNGTVPGTPTVNNITIATLTRDLLQNMVLDLLTVRGNKTTAVTEQFYGASIDVTYTYTEEVIDPEPEPQGDKLYIKDSGLVKPVTSAYKKIDDAWVLQDDLSTVFTEGTILVKMGRDGDVVYYTDNSGNIFADINGDLFIVDVTPFNINLFNRNKLGYVPGHLLKTDGTLTGWAPGAVSNYMKVNSDYIYLVQSPADSWDKLFYYDIAYNFIGCSHSLAYTEPEFQIGLGTKYSIPKNATYIRVNSLIAKELVFKRIQ